LRLGRRKAWGNVLTMELDWSSIVAAIVAFLALMASVFSAASAARSADVAVQAEKRAARAARTVAEREFTRTLGQIDLAVQSISLSLEASDRLAKSNASFYRDSAKYASTKAEIASRRAEVDALVTQIRRDQLSDLDDEMFARIQIETDRLLFKLDAQRLWAETRSAQLMESNRLLADDLTAEERAKSIHQRRDHEGKIY